MARRLEPLILLLLAVPTAAIDWQIAATWHLAAWISLLAASVTIVSLGAVWFAPRWRTVGSGLVISVLYGLPIVGAIIRWHLLPGKTALIGDGAYQTQLAGEFLLKGVDPYGADYGRAGLGAAPWGEPFVSPALHHLVTWPGQFLWPLPFQALVRTTGWWDERIFLLVAAGAICVMLLILFPGPAGRLGAAAFFLIPGHSLIAVLGDNDLPMLALVMAGLLAADRRRYLLMGTLLGLAVITKQHALLAVPFVATWAVVRGAGITQLVRSAGLGVFAGAVTVLPFLMWNLAAFVQDTIVFLAGSGPEAYPINGFGLSAILLHSGLIHGPRDAFPFAAIEILVAVLISLAGCWWIRRSSRLPDTLIFSGLALASVLFVSRYFHDSHLLLGAELVASGAMATFVMLGEKARVRAPMRTAA